MIKEFTITLALEGREVGAIQQFKASGNVLQIPKGSRLDIEKELEALQRTGIVRKSHLNIYLLTSVGKEILKALD